MERLTPNCFARRLRSRVNMKIGYGESMRNGFAFETYAEKGVDYLMPLVGRMSKMSDLIKIRDLAREKGLEKRGVIESVKYFKVDETRKSFAVRAAY